MNRPYAESCEQNKTYIFDAIQPYLHGRVLEIGSGTGQHAVYFAGLATDVIWQTSDLAENLDGICAWVDDCGLDNLPPPIELDVLGDWPGQRYDFVFTANSFHIMDHDAVEKCIAGIGRTLNPGGVFAVYGPFNYDGKYTSESNARFDQMLRARNVGSCIKDFVWLDQLAVKAGLELIDDIGMPANNRTIIWKNRTL